MRTARSGREFEIEVADILRAAGFRVEANPGAARPRQTDLYARSEGLYLLVEVKDRQRNVDVSDIDSLRARLNRTTADVVGIIFTTSRLTAGAIKAIETDRTREILAVVKSEIGLLRSRRQSLKTLIERKRHELRVQGKVWFGPIPRSEFLRVKLPPANVLFRVGLKEESYVVSKSSWARFSYALRIPDPGWGLVDGEGALLKMQLSLGTGESLRNILGYLHERFGLSRNGMFSIHQSEACWHGVGAENFLRAVGGWRERYRLSRLKAPHHSEELMYFDELRGGWVQLLARQRVPLENKSLRKDALLHGAELAIQLPGVPVDASQFQDLCRYTGNEWGAFEYVNRRSTCRRRLKRPLTLDFVGSVVRTEEEWSVQAKRERVVVGIIARNPFFQKRSLPRELRDEELSSLRELHTTELILCDLVDWHDEGDLADRYLLHGFEVAQTPGAQLIRPFGTWNRITSRAHPRSAADCGLEEMLARSHRETQV